MSTPDEKIIATALKRFKRLEEVEAENRRLALEDLKFSLGDQWDEAIRRARETDPNGARPCLTLDKTDQYIRQVVNDCRQNKPSIKIRPKDSGADVETADVLSGVVRQIEDQSDADIAYDTAVEMASRAGFGFLRVVTDYADDAGFVQDIFIREIENPFSCYLDPAGRFGFVWEDVPRDEFEADYPDADPCDWEASGPDQSDWIAEETVRVCEYFCCDYEQRTIWQAPDGSASDAEIPGAISRKVNAKRITWRKLTAKEVLEERPWPGQYIPLVQIFGHRINVAGERQYKSLHRPAQDAQRMYNYSGSAFVERVALTPKAPYIATVAQIEGHEDKWERANTANYSVLPYNPDPQNAPPPQRQQASDIPTGWMHVMQGMEHDIQGALGMYNAAIGQRGNATSGKQEIAQQREADNSTFHIVDNLARGIRQVGRIVVDLIPHIYDTARVVRILGEDGSEEFARINPDLETASHEVMDLNGQAIDRIYNPGVGRYDVAVSSGPAYGTRRQEAAETIHQVIQTAPNLLPVVGDLMFKSMDIPYADDIAERMRKMMPPELRDDEGGAPQIPPQVQQQMQQMGQMIEHLTGALNAAQQEIQQAQDKRGELAIKAREVGVKEYEAETERMTALAPAITPEQVQALVVQTMRDLMNGASQQPQRPQPATAEGLPA